MDRRTDGRTDGRTDRQNQSLNPAAYARGKNICYTVAKRYQHLRYNLNSSEPFDYWCPLEAVTSLSLRMQSFEFQLYVQNQLYHVTDESLVSPPVV